MIYSMWYNVPRLLSVGGLEYGGTDYVFGMKDVARANLKFNKLLLLHLVGHLLYLCQ